MSQVGTELTSILTTQDAWKFPTRQEIVPDDSDSIVGVSSDVNRFADRHELVVNEDGELEDDQQFFPQLNGVKVEILADSPMPLRNKSTQNISSPSTLDLSSSQQNSLASRHNHAVTDSMHNLAGSRLELSENQSVNTHYLNTGSRDDRNEIEDDISQIRKELENDFESARAVTAETEPEHTHATTPVRTLAPQPRTIPPPMTFYIPRDFSKGPTPRFDLRLPEGLLQTLDEETFARVVNRINQFFIDAEQVTTRLYLANILACFGGALVYLCVANPYDRHMESLELYIAQESDKTFAPRGLSLVSPLRNGLRVLEIRRL